MSVAPTIIEGSFVKYEVESIIRYLVPHESTSLDGIHLKLLKTRPETHTSANETV